MSAWILSIVGVICLGVLLEIVLPQGQTAKYVKGAFSLLVVFVIAAPLPKLLGGEWKLDVDGFEYEVNDAFVQETGKLAVENAQKELEDYLVLNGYETEVKIVLKQGSINDVESVHITVRLPRTEKNDAEKHTAAVRELAAKRLNERDNIIFVEIKIKSGQTDGTEKQ